MDSYDDLINAEISALRALVLMQAKALACFSKGDIAKAYEIGKQSEQIIDALQSIATKRSELDSVFHSESKGAIH